MCIAVRPFPATWPQPHQPAITRSPTSTLPRPSLVTSCRPLFPPHLLPRHATPYCSFPCCSMNITLWSVPGNDSLLTVPAAYANAAYQFYYDWTGVALPQQLGKLDLVAVPGKTFAMENWGLLLFDPERWGLDTCLRGGEGGGGLGGEGGQGVARGEAE